MPELPEVETVKRGLEPVMAGMRFVRVEQRRPDLRLPLPERFAERLTGRKVLSLGRRAKYLLAFLDGDETLVIHLGMSGRLTVTLPQGAGRSRVLGEYTYDTGRNRAHDHVVFAMSGGAVITYNDPRRFGLMTLVTNSEMAQHKLFAGLGVEPLDGELTAAYLAACAHNKAVDLKAFLMDQRIVAGLGNIYVCEALFRCGLAPSRGAAVLARRNGRPSVHAERLVPAIRSVLEEAITAGGSTLHDYTQADGTAGAFQNSFAVYGRSGERCTKPNCRGTIRRVVQAGRSTFFCGKCQR
ncbi:MAG: bifunctional DNA-formamidopyrimidine glycosylase/DNA-(apurinic or apyrimidinic site) lyase [Hyphomicrobiaceae bacterium]